MRPGDQKLGSSLVPSVKSRLLGRNQHSGRCSGLHLVGLLLQLLVSLHKTDPVSIGNGKQLMDGICTR